MPADLTKIDEPFGELDDATKGALLLAHHNDAVIEYYDSQKGWQFRGIPKWFYGVKYRVQPAPAVMGSVTMHGVEQTHQAIYPIASTPFPNRLTFTVPTRDGLHIPGVYTSPDGLQIVIEVAK